MQRKPRSVCGNCDHSSQAPPSSLVQSPQRVHSLDGRAAVSQGGRMVGSHLRTTQGVPRREQRVCLNTTSLRQHMAGQRAVQMTLHRRQITQSKAQVSKAHLGRRLQRARLAQRGFERVCDQAALVRVQHPAGNQTAQAIDDA